MGNPASRPGQRILLHACCAPCSIAVIDELRSVADLTVFFFNPNIYPLDEYLKRKAEVGRLCAEWSVPVVDGDYDPAAWENSVGRIRQEKDGGPRCSACIRWRLEAAARLAKSLGYDAFATSLSSGRQKKSAVVNGIGRALADLHGINFIDEDWKKGGRTEKALAMVKERGIYRQAYCGCRHSRAGAQDARVTDADRPDAVTAR